MVAEGPSPHRSQHLTKLGRESMLPETKWTQTEARVPSSLVEVTRTLEEARDALRGYEVTALAGVAEALSGAVRSLLETLERLEEMRPEEWMTPHQASRYLGFPSAGAFERVVAKEGIPKHYLSDRLPRYSRSELDAWLTRH